MELNICMLLTSQHLQSTPLWLRSDLKDHLILPIRLRSQIGQKAWIPVAALLSECMLTTCLALSTEHWSFAHYLCLASGLSPFQCQSAWLPVCFGFHYSRPAFATQSKSQHDLWAPNPGFSLSSIRIDFKQLGLPYFHFLILSHLIILHFKHLDLPTFYNPLKSDTACTVQTEADFIFPSSKKHVR